MSDYFPEDSRLWPDDRAREEARRELEEVERVTELVQEAGHGDVPLRPRVRVNERRAA